MPASPSARRVLDRPTSRVVLVVASLAIAVAVGLALTVAVGFAITPAAGAPSVQDDGTNDSGNDSTDAAAELQPVDVANASGNATEPVTIEGEGQTVTDSVELEDGLLVVAYAHEGESNFQVDLWNDSADERSAFLVNDIGQTEGATAVPVTAGNYSLDVNADGAWNATLVQPNTTAAIAAQAGNDTGGNASGANASGVNDSDSDAGAGNETVGVGANATDATNTTDAENATIANPPATASGEGPAVVGPIELDESATVTGNHSGESNFQVELWRENATSLFDVAFVFNEIGQVEAAESRVDHAGLSWIVVQADGEWDLRID